MMNLTKVLAEDRRLAMLRTLAEVPGYNLNEDIVRQVLERLGSPGATKDLIRADLQFLEQHGLIRVEKMPKATGDLWIAHLLLAGQDVANGRPHAGIAQLQPDD
jgi:predicted transcriptional regulator